MSRAPLRPSRELAMMIARLPSLATVGFSFLVVLELAACGGSDGAEPSNTNQAGQGASGGGQSGGASSGGTSQAGSQSAAGGAASPGGASPGGGATSIAGQG